jgi:hypothetical protein
MFNYNGFAKYIMRGKIEKIPAYLKSDVDRSETHIESKQYETFTTL